MCFFFSCLGLMSGVQMGFPVQSRVERKGPNAGRF